MHLTYDLWIFMSIFNENHQQPINIVYFFPSNYKNKIWLNYRFFATFFSWFLNARCIFLSSLIMRLVYLQLEWEKVPFAVTWNWKQLQFADAVDLLRIFLQLTNSDIFLSISQWKVKSWMEIFNPAPHDQTIYCHAQKSWTLQKNKSSISNFAKCHSSIGR